MHYACGLPVAVAVRVCGIYARCRKFKVLICLIRRFKLLVHLAVSYRSVRVTTARSVSVRGKNNTYSLFKRTIVLSE